jgi:type IV pilus assembly protein PilA
MNKKTKKGFTLIELIVVIAILAILAVIAIPVVNGLVSNAGASAAEANARTLELAVKADLTGGEISAPVDSAEVDTAISDFGLTANELTGGGKYNLVVSTSSGAVVGTYVKTGGTITP